MRFSVCLLFVLIAGCASPQTGAPVPLHSLYHECARPDAPDIAGLDPDAHIAAPGNTDLLLTLIDAMSLHIRAQRDALDCYTAQSRGMQ